MPPSLGFVWYFPLKSPAAGVAALLCNLRSRKDRRIAYVDDVFAAKKRVRSCVACGVLLLANVFRVRIRSCHAWFQFRYIAAVKQEVATDLISNANHWTNALCALAF